MSFALVLHAHIPYCRKSGRWPAGEEWLHEAIIESYLPLLKVLEGLEARDISPNLNIEFTPILLEQLADGYMQEQFIVYLQELIDRATSDIRRFDGRPELQSVAKQYQEDFSLYMDYYTGHLKRDVIGAFKHHQDSGNIEIFTSAATHGFLPLFEHESAIWSQVKIGIDTYKKYFGCNPRGFWLPECAFRPMETRNGRQVAGIDYWLKKAGIEYFIVNYTGMEDATLVHANTAGVDYISTYEAYQLAGTGVKVFGRNYETSERVWSAAVGYPGNQVYREFHLKDPVSGLRYFSISKPGLAKDVYDFSRAREKAKLDARDFARIVYQNLSDYRSINKRSGIIVSPYDCELFGHWWHEGPVWMEDVFINLAEMEEISPITLGTYLDDHTGTFSEV
ncbi:1,4-alpha-glucan branching protein, partial [Candidatus Bathyarchaeota archaeon]|nr:1,4-alpha-glucan branching protein [Candidatus Bathyarchaeota archaeon]